MANKKQNAAVTEDPEVVIETALGRTEEWIRVNGKTLLTVLIAVIVIVGGYFCFQYLYKAPRQEKAVNAIFNAQNAFESGLYDLALNGDGNTEGFLQVASKYGSTPTGNLASHYAGICYLRLGQYQDAIASFGKYNNVKGIPAQLINSTNEGLTGDAYVQLGDLQKGVSQYEKAMKTGKNDQTTPYYARKAGVIHMQLGDYKKALECFNVIKVEYPGSPEAREVEKYIAQAEQQL